MKHDTKKQASSRRLNTQTPLKAAALLTMASLTGTAGAAEVGVFARKSMWGDGVFIAAFPQGVKAQAGSISSAQTGFATPGNNGPLNSYASAGFHGLAVSGSAKVQGGGSSGLRPEVGGGAYWFEQLTISSPSVPAGTIGTADFTLFFQGLLDISPPTPFQGGTNIVNISYRWAADIDNADNVADPNSGATVFKAIDVFSGYAETSGVDFLNTPRNHQLLFRFGQPFDFTVGIYARAGLFAVQSKSARADVRLTGWNGFRNIRIRDTGVAVTDTGINSQTGFNYAQSGSTTYSDWARLYQLPAASPQVDSNNNGLIDLLEYALGRNPLDAEQGAPSTPGVMNVGGQDYACLTFTRPAFGARAGDVTYLPQRSTALSGWSGAGLETTVTPSATTQTETVTVRSTQPMTTQTGEFFRLEVAPAAAP